MNSTINSVCFNKYLSIKKKNALTRELTVWADIPGRLTENKANMGTYKLSYVIPLETNALKYMYSSISRHSAVSVPIYVSFHNTCVTNTLCTIHNSNYDHRY